MGLCLYIYNFLGSYHFLLFWSYGQFSVLCFFLLITSSGFSLQTQLAFLTLISQLYEMYVMNPKVGLNQKETKCLAGIQTQATSKCKDECVCSSFELVLVFHWGERELLLFLQVPCLVVGNFYHFKNEGYLLEVFKIWFSN